MFRKLRPLVLGDPARGANVVDEVSIARAQFEHTTVSGYLRLKKVRH
jgi:hypothetical protein